MTGGFPVDLILFAMIAAFLVLRLRSVLGKRTGFERPVQPEARTSGYDPRGGTIEGVAEEVPALFADLSLSQGVEAWLRAVFACNQYIDAQAPWTLRKTDPERMLAVLATLYEAIGDLALAISPVIPNAAAKLLDQMGIPDGERSLAALGDTGRYGRLVESGFTLQPPVAIFPRLEQPQQA